jgi:hypothetical protein
MKKAAPAKPNAPAAKARNKPATKKSARARDADSDDVERAVYDGMQDLRVKKPAGK